MSNKYIICCDFDGVLHSYTSGWQGADVIPDPMVPGALEWLLRIASNDRFELAIYSSRSKDPKGLEAMKEWIRCHIYDYYRSSPGIGPYIAQAHGGLYDEDIFKRLTFPTQKPAASMTIDDRAFHFQGRFPSVEWLLTFKPWTKVKDRRSVLLDRPSRARVEEIRVAFEMALAEAGDTVHLDSSDAAIGDLLAEIDHLNIGDRV